MKRSRNIDDIKVASPCPASWADMIGDDKVRFCKTCSLNVYNLTAMSRAEAQSVLDNAKGRLCVRFYRRQDGRVLTQDCPIGAKERKQKRTGDLITASAAALAVAAASPAFRTSSFGEEVGEASASEGAFSMGSPGVPAENYMMGKIMVQPRSTMGEVPPIGRIRMDLVRDGATRPVPDERDFGVDPEQWSPD